MNFSPQQLQNKLPRVIGIHRHVPNRLHLSWDTLSPSAVHAAKDLPPYLILGPLDRESFKATSDGWSATWQGTEEDTHFKLKYRKTENRYDIHQTWDGIEGGFSICPERIGLKRFILQGLYSQFPSQWDSRAKKSLEEKYQLTYVEQPENMASFCGMPDGAFRTIALPVAVRNIEVVGAWLSEISKAEVPYPFSSEAKLLLQATNYLEGVAPPWTCNPVVVFEKSINDTGLMPIRPPVRETAADGTSAWTLHREVYVIFITVPFAGLTDILEKLCSSNGPIRRRHGEDLSVELQPVIFPGGFEVQAQSVSYWDSNHSTRTTFLFSQDGKSTQPGDMMASLQSPADSLKLLNIAKEISSDLVAAVSRAMRNA